MSTLETITEDYLYRRESERRNYYEKNSKSNGTSYSSFYDYDSFTPVYAESTDTEDTAAVDWEKGENIKAIKEKGVITVATGTYVPFEYRDDDDNIVGFDIDLAQYIADKLGVDMEVTDMEFQSIVPSIQNGEYDFSIAAMYKTDERCEVVDMSKSYCDSGMILA